MNFVNFWINKFMHRMSVLSQLYRNWKRKTLKEKFRPGLIGPNPGPLAAAGPLFCTQADGALHLPASPVRTRPPPPPYFPAAAAAGARLSGGVVPVAPGGPYSAAPPRPTPPPRRPINGSRSRPRPSFLPFPPFFPKP
jgi:hypothetical protein